MPGQTIEHVALAEARFLEKVIQLHPDADGKPCVVGNCQAGWALMMLAAIRPELFGPIIIAGSPLSYWAGVRGKNPMRYTGGLVGGSWLTAFASDMGDGKFDGAWLVQNFENQNPANTFWQKPYNLYSKIDTEAPRYLNFERWWGGHTNLNAREIQFIADELFIGNNLSGAKICTSENVAVDLRNIRTPIVVFCSKGDNITPPQQALWWIVDLYESVDEIRSYGQTIVYTIHESVGHLGIFVSGGVAKKEHGQLSSNVDLIDTLPPGLYEAVFENKTEQTSNPELASRNWVMRCEARTLEDIRALGGNDLVDERRFAAAARVSELNLAMYRTFLQPTVRACANSSLAEWFSRCHPLRLQYEIFSNANPMMAPVAEMVGPVRQARRAVTADNPFLKLQEITSHNIIAMLEGCRELSERLAESAFLTVYGSPILQSVLGVSGGSKAALRKPSKSLLHRELLGKRIAELRSHIPIGGLREATIRALLYAGMGRRAIDERGFEAVRRIREANGDLSLSAFKELVREQFNILLIDNDAALAAIPSMLPLDAEARRVAFGLIKTVLSARGEVSVEDGRRLEEVARLFASDGKALSTTPSSGPKHRELAAQAS
jgi:pimeloyl-ACP methyl ester carboxylesterase